MSSEGEAGPFNKECPVCLEEGKMLTLGCGHGIHDECCSGLVNLTCPICRKEVEWSQQSKERILKNRDVWERELKNGDDDFATIYSIVISMEIDPYFFWEVLASMPTG